VKFSDYRNNDFGIRNYAKGFGLRMRVPLLLDIVKKYVS